MQLEAAEAAALGCTVADMWQKMVAIHEEPEASPPARLHAASTLSGAESSVGSERRTLTAEVGPPFRIGELSPTVTSVRSKRPTAAACLVASTSTRNATASKPPERLDAEIELQAKSSRSVRLSISLRGAKLQQPDQTGHFRAEVTPEVSATNACSKPLPMTSVVDWARESPYKERYLLGAACCIAVVICGAVIRTLGGSKK